MNIKAYDLSGLKPEECPCVPRVPFTNRELRRKGMKEFLINNRDLINIELDFWEALTVSDMTYNTVFSIYSAVYGTRLDGMTKRKRFKLTRPDPDYFIKKFKPLDEFI
jgi:hypothetical protein